MKTPSKIALAAGVVSASGAMAIFAATPAMAAAGLLLPTIGIGGTGAHHVTANCTPGAGVATNLNQITYAIAATSSSFSTNGSVPIGTSVQCYAYNVDTGGVYASISGGLPGAEGAAAGTVTVPTNANAALCVKANALFNDNGTASFDNCPF
jgi:hypothetical protein